MFNNRLRESRKKRSFTQQNMADMLELSLNAYQKYEQKEREPSLSTLTQIANILDVSTDYLLGRDEFLKSHGVSFDEYL